MIDTEFYRIILALLMATASGLVGSFALMRRMSLAGDAISHIALPGIALAILYSVNPAIGAAIALLIAAVVIWKVEKISKLNTEAIIGVLFAFSLALGGLLIQDEHELMELLFGNESGVALADFIPGVIIATFIISYIVKKKYALTLSIISKDLSKTAGINKDMLELSFLLVFSLTVLLGLKFLGILLMGSLIIIPAATAKNLATNLNGMLIMASLVACASVILGIAISQIFNLALGPAIVSVGSVLFFISLFFGSRNN